jgi:hypothetical protein
MNSMNTRRNFFKYLGLAGGVAGGGIVAAAAVLPDPEKTSAIKKMTEQTDNNIQFTQKYGVKAPKSNVESPYNNLAMFSNEKKFIPGTEKDVVVAMNVGPDGELYLKVNNKWRRIVTE